MDINSSTMSRPWRNGCSKRADRASRSSSTRPRGTACAQWRRRPRRPSPIGPPPSISAPMSRAGISTAGRVSAFSGRRCRSRRDRGEQACLSTRCRPSSTRVPASPPRQESLLYGSWSSSHARRSRRAASPCLASILLRAHERSGFPVCRSRPRRREARVTRLQRATRAAS